MDNKKYTVTLADGTELKNLTLNGNNFISRSPISKDIFENNCSPVRISDGETEEVHENMALIHVTRYDDGDWFALRDLSDAELVAIKNRADIDYIALMCDVDL